MKAVNYHPDAIQPLPSRSKALIGLRLFWIKLCIGWKWFFNAFVLKFGRNFCAIDFLANDIQRHYLN